MWGRQMACYASLVRKPAAPAASLARRRPALQLRAAGPRASAVRPPDAVATSGLSGSARVLPYFDRIQQSFGPRHDLSSVRAYVGGSASAAAGKLGALAFTLGDQVAFRGPPDLFTAAHEAAHVVQQRGIANHGQAGGDASEREADRVAHRVVQGGSSEDLLGQSAPGQRVASVQMRRLPADVEALLTDPSNPSIPAPNFDASAEGMSVLLGRAVASLKPAELTRVQTIMLGGVSWPDFVKLPQDLILTRASDAIQKVRPDLTLGDPKLIDTGPRKGTADAANIQKLVDNAKKVFDQIGTGKVDKDLADVFGAGHIAEAKTQYAKGRFWMRRLDAREKIVTDRSGYSGEVDLGGLTSFHTQIALSPETIDNPDDKESIVTLIHEAVHSGNDEVSDKGYIDQPSFTELPADVKLTNAAHFEVVPRRILGAGSSFPGVRFIPAGTTVGGVTAAPLTDAQKAIRKASETFRGAWTAGLNLHSLFVDVYKQPTAWTVDQGGGRTYKGGLPYWSKVEKLTVHRKTVIEPASPDPAKQPVSQIDVALSEGLVRKMAQTMVTVPPNEAAADTFEKARSNPVERNAALTTVDAHGDFLMKLVLQEPKIAPVTGPVDRDLRVVKELNNVYNNWGDVLKSRNPDDFKD
jgi:hypothetical protein